MQFINPNAFSVIVHALNFSFTNLVSVGGGMNETSTRDQSTMPATPVTCS